MSRLPDLGIGNSLKEIVLVALYGFSPPFPRIRPQQREIDQQSGQIGYVYVEKNFH